MLRLNINKNHDTLVCNENGNYFSALFNDVYSEGFRRAALQLYSFFGNMKTVASALHIGVATIWRWLRLGIHRSQSCRDACKDKGLLPVYIPPYSPDFNPIENVFTVMKNSYRKLIIDQTLNQNDIIATTFDGFQDSLFQAVFKHWQKLVTDT